MVQLHRIRKIIFLVTVFLVSSNLLVFSQQTSIDSVSILSVMKREKINLNYWPSGYISRILIRNIDSTFTMLGFNYIGKLETKVDVKIINNQLLYEGKWVVFSEDGNLLSICICKNGKKNGLYKQFYTNGNVSEEGKYLNNEPVGRWIYYNINGKVKKTVYF